MILKINGTEFLVDFDHDGNKVTKIESIKVLTKQNIRFEIKEQSKLTKVIEEKLNEFIKNY